MGDLWNDQNLIDFQQRLDSLRAKLERARKSEETIKEFQLLNDKYKKLHSKFNNPNLTEKIEKIGREYAELAAKFNLENQ